MSYIYLSAPYTHASKDIQQMRRKAVALEALEIFTDEETPVVSPLTMFEGFELYATDDQQAKLTHEKCMELCEAMQEQAGQLYVFMLPGWEQSTGVELEIELAEKLEMPIEYIKPDSKWITEHYQLEREHEARNGSGAELQTNENLKEYSDA